MNVIGFANRQALQTWWMNKIIFVFLFIIGIMWTMLISALVISWWYPFYLLAFLPVLIDIVMVITVPKTVINAEPRLNVKLLFWVIRASGNH